MQLGSRKCTGIHWQNENLGDSRENGDPRSPFISRLGTPCFLHCERSILACLYRTCPTYWLAVFFITNVDWRQFTCTSEQGQLKSIAIFATVATPIAMLYQVGLGIQLHTSLKAISKVLLCSMHTRCCELSAPLFIIQWNPGISCTVVSNCQPWWGEDRWVSVLAKAKMEFDEDRR